MYPWQAVVLEIALVDPYDVVDGLHAEQHVLFHFTDQPDEVVGPMFEDLILPLKGSSVDENIRTNYQRILGALMTKLSKEHQFVLVKTCVDHLAEDLKTAEINWYHLWAIIAAYNPYVANHPQKRQVRSLARKLHSVHPDYKNHFTYEQLVAMPELARLNRMERFKHFRELNPKWLTNSPAE